MILIRSLAFLMLIFPTLGLISTSEEGTPSRTTQHTPSPTTHTAKVEATPIHDDKNYTISVQPVEYETTQQKEALEKFGLQFDAEKWPVLDINSTIYQIVVFEKKIKKERHMFGSLGKGTLWPGSLSDPLNGSLTQDELFTGEALMWKEVWIALRKHLNKKFVNGPGHNDEVDMNDPSGQMRQVTFAIDSKLREQLDTIFNENKKTHGLPKKKIPKPSPSKTRFVYGGILAGMVFERTTAGKTFTAFAKAHGDLFTKSKELKPRLTFAFNATEKEEMVSMSFATRSGISPDVLPLTGDLLAGDLENL